MPEPSAAQDHADVIRAFIERPTVDITDAHATLSALDALVAENERLRVALTAIIALAQSPSWEVAHDALR